MFDDQTQWEVEVVNAGNNGGEGDDLGATLLDSGNIFATSCQYMDTSRLVALVHDRIDLPNVLKIVEPSVYMLGCLENIHFVVKKGDVSREMIQFKLREYVLLLKEKWMIDLMSKLTPDEILLLVRRNFGLFETDVTLHKIICEKDPNMILSQNTIINYMELYLLAEIYMVKRAVILINAEMDFADDMSKILGVFYYSANLIKNFYSIGEVVVNGLDKNSLDFSVLGFRLDEANGQQGDIPLLLGYIEKKMIDKDYRKCGEYLFAKIYTRDGQFTRAWRRMTSVREFLYHICNTGASTYKNIFYYNPSRPEAIIKMVIEDQHNNFKDFTRSRFVFSFRNGLYYTNYCPYGASIGVGSSVYDLFIPYEHAAKYIGTDLYASKYFDYDFVYYPDPELLALNIPFEWDLHKFGNGSTRGADELKSWMDIPTPSIQRIFDNQFVGLTEEEKDSAISMIHYIYIGRWCYPVRHLDDWQTVMMIVGIANTGKSSIVNVLSEFFAPEDIGTLANDMEKMFGLAPLAKKLANLGADLNNKFTMSQPAFQSMITGERMSVPAKYKDAMQMERWTASTFMVGNTFLGFEDKNGSIPRRVVTSKFTHKIARNKVDGGLGAALSREVPMLLHKSIRGYLTTIRRRGTESFWNWCPQYFWETRIELSSNSNPITSFCNSKDHIIIGADEYCPKQKFIEYFNAYCIRNNLTKTVIDPNNCMETFEDIKQAYGVTISLRRARLPWPRVESVTEQSECETQEFYFGLNLRIKSIEDSLAGIAETAATFAPPQRIAGPKLVKSVFDNDDKKIGQQN